ncbi:MAG: TerD family protein [Methylococcaceae bacterium]|nr:TerD family protein [Methylococcaceae bacterium]OYV22125.1 MAG: tellurium resistance protein TerZ [Methylococcaceae bacterium NSO1]
MAINLQKGQKISLSKESGGALSKVVMGLGWDAKKSGGGMLKGMFGGGSSSSIDLDASCVLFNDQNKVVDTVYFGQLKSRDGSIVHTGDNRTGDGDGDDEQIIVDLDKIPATVKRYTLSAQGSHTAQIMAKLYRHGGEWKMHAIGENGTGRTIENLLPQIVVHL